MKNNRRINLTNCNFNFKNKNGPNTNEVKASSSNFGDSVCLQESLQTRKKSQKIKVINNSLEESVQIAKRQTGITLIALVVTIVVLLILAGVSISTVLGNNGIIPRANEAKFKTELASIQEEFTLYVTDRTVENSNFSVGSLNASRDLLTYNTQPDEEKGTGNINSVLKSSVAQKYIKSKSFSIIKGDLIYASQNKKELEWAQEVGIAINPYNIDENGVLLSSETNLMLVDKATGTLVIPEMVTAIGEGTFGLVQGVKRVVIPPTVREIKQNAFANCTSLEEVIFETKTEDGVITGTEIIGNNAFTNCTGLSRVQLPESLKSIGSWGFSSCTSLTNINLPRQLTVIRVATFAGDINLIEITIPDNVQIIEMEAFRNCSKITKINIPAKLTTLGTGVFIYCSSLRDIQIDENHQYFTFENGILFNKSKTKMLVIFQSMLDKNQATFEIPPTVTQISGALLSEATWIHKVVVHKNVAWIDDFRFFSSYINNVEIDTENEVYKTDRKCNIKQRWNSVIYVL